MKNVLDHYNYIPMDYEKTNKEEFFQSVTNILRDKGYVKDSFSYSILERERKFPTGIMLENFGIAIPHTEGEHVYNSSVVVTYCKNPIMFQSMDDPTVSVPAKLILVLALKEPGEHLAFLSKLMEKFQDETFKDQMKLAKSSEEATNLLRDFKIA